MSYVDVAGLTIWHEVTGAGRPVVLLHGGFAGAASWGDHVPRFVEAGYRVHVPERRAHGHTPDVDGPLTYELMAEDTIAYLEQEVAGPTALIGWSDGAVVGALVALRRPDLVDRLVLIGQYYNCAGKLPRGIVDMLAEDPGPVMQFLRAGYDPISPDGPDHFPIVYEKMLRMLTSSPEIDLADLSAIAAPTLVLQGDRDDVTVAHSVAVVDAIPDARLAVLPGTHLLPIESPHLVGALLLSFLDDGTSTRAED